MKKVLVILFLLFLLGLYSQGTSSFFTDSDTVRGNSISISSATPSSFYCGSGGVINNTAISINVSGGPAQVSLQINNSVSTTTICKIIKHIRIKIVQTSGSSSVTDTTTIGILNNSTSTQIFNDVATRLSTLQAQEAPASGETSRYTFVFTPNANTPSATYLVSLEGENN